MGKTKRRTKDRLERLESALAAIADEYENEAAQNEVLLTDLLAARGKHAAVTEQDLVRYTRLIETASSQRMVVTTIKSLLRD